MRIIREDDKKTKTKFYGNDPYNPSIIHTGRFINEGVELELRPIVEMDFKFDNERRSFFYVASGINAEIIDVDTGYHYELYNDCIFKLLKFMTNRNVDYLSFNEENHSIRGRFRVLKVGRIYKLELLEESLGI